MAHATATFPDVTLRYGSAFAHGGSRRNKSGRPAIGVGAVAASGAFGLVAVTAVCLVAIVISGNGATHARLSPSLAMPVALLNPYPTSAGAETFSGSALVAGPAYVRQFVGAAPARTQLAALTPAATPMPALTASLPLPLRRPQMLANSAPLPRARPLSRAQAPADEFTTASIGGAAERTPVAVATKPQPATEQRVASLEPPKAAAPREPDRRTAVYDIAAATVYMPNGQKLEAHSGLGHRRDNPRYVSQRNRGPTPPNVYDLSLRERIFHGVRAIRLNPHDEDKMFGRDGMLAHTYMLGRSGQSFGCVSFKNYNAFLQAYLKGDIDRLIVVAHSDAPPASIVRAHPRAPDRLALNSQ
jgi:Tlde1 domain